VVLFLLLLFSIIVFFVLFRKGKLGAWWHKYEKAKMDSDEGVAPLDVEKTAVADEKAGAAAPVEAKPAAAAVAPKSPAEIEKDERS